MSDRDPPSSDASSTDPAPQIEETPPPDIQEIGSASRSCLVILALAVVIVLLICVSWLARLLF